MKNKIRILGAALLLPVLILLSYFSGAGNEQEEHSVASAPGNGFAVVELFTSEGCSSCPPADLLAEDLQKKTFGKNVYVLTYHVDYWDRLGWKDRFSSPENTARQYQYSRWFNGGTIFTPQFVINGSSQFAGFSQSNLYDAVSDALQQGHPGGLSLGLEQSAKTIQVNYDIKETESNLKLIVALVKRHDSTSIRRGENTGRLLEHVQIVQQFKTVELDKEQGAVVINKPEKFIDAQWEVIGFLQNQGTGVISAACKAELIH